MGGGGGGGPGNGPPIHGSCSEAVIAQTPMFSQGLKRFPDSKPGIFGAGNHSQYDLSGAAEQRRGLGLSSAEEGQMLLEHRNDC